VPHPLTLQPKLNIANSEIKNRFHVNQDFAVKVFKGESIIAGLFSKRN